MLKYYERKKLMTEKEFEDRFAKTWSTALSEDDISKLCNNAAQSTDSIIVLAKILLDFQKAAVKAVLKEFLLNDEQ